MMLPNFAAHYRCVHFLDVMLRLGQEAILQYLWLYERYEVPSGESGGMTKCEESHFGQDKGMENVL